MMGDSFFTGRNVYDDQLQSFSPAGAEDIIEAAVRHLCKVRGYHATAARLYRLADVTSGAQVMPLEILLQVSKPAPAPAKPESRFGRFWIGARVALCFWSGFFFGFMAGGH